MVSTTTLLDLRGSIARGDLAWRFVRAFFTALQTRRLRAAEDPQMVARLQEFSEALARLAAGDGAVRLQRFGPHLWVGRTRLRPLPEHRLLLRSVLGDFERWGIGGLEFQSDADPAALASFIELYPTVDRCLLAARPEGGRLEVVVELSPQVRALPAQRELNPEEMTPEEARAQARRTFFRALAAARSVTRQCALGGLPELRKTRAVVHEMVDTLVEEEFSLLGMTAIQNFDPYTFQHSVHVSILSMALGQRLGLSRGDLAALGVSAMFHDMGKTRVPKEVLHKPGRFDDTEWRVMRTHPLSGARELLRTGSVSDLLVQVMLVSAEHHLRFDGSGYPPLGDSWQQGLFARIVTLADCFDAMTASRIYMKRPFTPDAVIRYLFENSGRMFDPDLLRLFVEMVGLYPVGSLVRLESGELAVVAEPPTQAREVDRPAVVTLEPGGQGWRVGSVRRLADGAPVDPRCRIQAGCHPQDHEVDVDAVLAQVYLEAA
ncbi:MAG: HD-GYP domain-containing protein [Candidatus Eisenbacteria bacterium]|nr:HD-GYP domain-containing protein [Candidatus Eisenbacteria bacterium]MCC7144800.1 HD-GYP domain-containing protein [Candidatus Eisenbacteria bacterium]